MEEEKELEFWFSKKQKDRCIDMGDKHVNTVKGKLYSECFDANKGHKSNWDDAYFICRGTYADIKHIYF